jgi:glucuronokinase
VTTVQRATGVALARAALAGNPSDGYGGAVLAVTLPMWAARADAVGADAGAADAGGAERARALVVEPANELVEATVRRFAHELEPAALASAVRWRTSIPQQVGLGSSSALVIAVLRALAELHRVALDPDRLAELALAVETEGLGIVAGLQDRVAQAYEGLTFMEFGGGGSRERPDRAGSYERLDPALLPPLVIAWRTDAAAHSSETHARLRARHKCGDPPVRAAMASLADAARGARDALADGDYDSFGLSVDRTYDLRRELMQLDPRCVEMIEAARRCHASANYTGSGGAIVAVCRDRAHADGVADVLGAAGCAVSQYP